MYSSLAIFALISVAVEAQTSSQCNNDWKNMCKAVKNDFSDVEAQLSELGAVVDCNKKAYQAWCKDALSEIDTFTKDNDGLALAGLVVREVVMESMSAQSGVARTFIMLNEEDFPVEEETEEDDVTEDDEPPTGGETETVDDGEGSGDDDEGDEEVVLEFDWDMDRCKADWEALCASAFKDTEDVGDACLPEIIESECLQVSVLVELGLTDDVTTQALKDLDERVSALFTTHSVERTVGGFQDPKKDETDKDDDTTKTDGTTDETDKTTDGEETEEAGSATLMASATALAIGSMMLY